MPSAMHNILVELLEAHPEALSYLLDLHGAPPSGPLVPTAGTRTRTVTLERRIDRAFLVGSREAPESFLFLEVQLAPDADKRFSWSLSLELGRSRYRCEGALVVLTLSAAVRRWIARAIVPPTGAHGTSRQLVPTVLALDEVSPDLLLRPDMPYLAPLAVAAHGQTPDARAIAERAIDLTLDELPNPLAAEQLDVILGMVNTTFVIHLRERATQHRQYRSELFRGIYEKAAAEGKAEGLAEGEAKGLAEGKAEGLAEGKAEGLAEGKTEGEATGKAESILLILSGRGIPTSSALRKRILACKDIEVLDLWLQRALKAPTAAAVVRATPAPRRTARGPGPRTAKR